MNWNNSIFDRARISLVLVTVLGALHAATAQSPAARAGSAPPDSLVRYWIRPSATDPAIKRFDLPHHVVFAAHVKPDAPLLVFTREAHLWR